MFWIITRLKYPNINSVELQEIIMDRLKSEGFRKFIDDFSRYIIQKSSEIYNKMYD